MDLYESKPPKEYVSDSPRVEALIEKVMANHPGTGPAALAAYFEAAYQELAPLARQLEIENATLCAVLAKVNKQTKTAKAI